MNTYRDPQGVNFEPVKTEPPVGAPNPVGQNGQFGVEGNQVSEDGDVPDLTTKAQLDLAGKIDQQRRG